jgi:hypothetical protein
VNSFVEPRFWSRVCPRVPLFLCRTPARVFRFKIYPRDAPRLSVPVFKAHVQKLVEETRKVLALRYIATQDQRIASYIQDFERTDRIIQERAEALKHVPGGSSGLIARDFKAVKDEVVEVYEFDAALVRERRAIRKDVAEELGQLSQKHEFSFSGNINDMTPAQLEALEKSILEAHPQLALESAKVVETTAELVDTQST